MYDAVFIELLLYFGINLNETEAVQIAMQARQENLMKQQQ